MTKSSEIARGACPECAGNVLIDTEAKVSSLVFHANPGGMPTLTDESRHTIVAFCSSCEFCVEIRP